MSANEWLDLLEGLYYSLGGVILWSLAVFLAVSFLTAIMFFMLETFSSRPMDE